MKLHLEPAMVERFEQYLSLLLKWNARTNLTSVREPDQIVQRHFAESIFAAEQLPSDVKTLLDFGSGAGFPGIPIAICRPKTTVTLAESQGKKAAFLREAVRTLGLKAEVWAGRVEAMPEERVFDAVTLRAVDKMPAACRTAVRRLAEGGWVGVFATRATEDAIRAVPGLRWGDAVTIPGAEQAVLLQGRSQR
ncbi:MAG TPA: 16S rRNA (guanine(527)-N(7))-methyltransferase RsmG [Acidobacteriaceae bacterium]|nr:16S rRNA (guanine(527)-N(7))-methyltransferase RsmG [Acidobacteriaceae bacterium]